MAGTHTVISQWRYRPAWQDKSHYTWYLIEGTKSIMVLTIALQHLSQSSQIEWKRIIFVTSVAGIWKEQTRFLFHFHQSKHLPKPHKDWMSLSHTQYWWPSYERKPINILQDILMHECCMGEQRSCSSIDAFIKALEIKFFHWIFHTENQF